MLNICFMVPKVYPLFNPKVKIVFGGAEKQVYLIGKYLSAKENYKINYAVFDYNQNFHEKYDNIEIWKVFQKNFINLLTKSIKYLLNIKSDYYIFRGDDKKVFLLALFLKYVFKKKFFFFITTDSSLEFNFLLYKIFLKSADRVFCQKKKQKEVLEKKYKINSAILPNIYEVPKDNTKSNKSNRKDILWIGRSEEIKRPEIFLNLALQNQNESFCMIMPEATGKSLYYKKLLADGKKIKNLKILNFVPNNEINDYYLKAKIYVLTSISEGFSNTMMEAMYNKCPILSLKIDPDGILEKNNIALIAKDNINDFQIKFDSLINNPELRDKLGQNGYNYIVKNHHQDVIIDKFINYINL